MIEMFQNKEHEFLTKLQEFCPHLLKAYPLSGYCESLKKKDPYSHYEQFPGRLRASLQDIKRKYGPGVLALYHKAGLCRLVTDFLHRSGSRQLPIYFESLYHEWFERIYKDFSSMPDAYYDHEKRLWPLRKDLSICSGRAIPVGGAWLIEQRRMRRQYHLQNAQRFDPVRGIDEDQPRKNRHLKMLGSASGYRHDEDYHTLEKRITAIKKQIGKFERVYAGLKKLATIAREVTGQYDWIYVIHTVDSKLQDFTRKKMNFAYRNIAELLKNDSRIWGVFRESWFLDPNLKLISPQLSFLWEEPLRNGATLYHAGPCYPYQIQWAIWLSPERNQAYKDGRYTPELYFYLWPRENIINGNFDTSYDKIDGSIL